jgi:hypothetical protein
LSLKTERGGHFLFFGDKTDAAAAVHLPQPRALLLLMLLPLLLLLMALPRTLRVHGDYSRSALLAKVTAK